MTTKASAILKLAKALEITKPEAALVYGTVAEIALEGVHQNGVFILPGLGRLKALTRNARKARNPKTGTMIDVPAKVVLKLIPSKVVKDQFKL